MKTEKLQDARNFSGNDSSIIHKASFVFFNYSKNCPITHTSHVFQSESPTSSSFSQLNSSSPPLSQPHQMLQHPTASKISMPRLSATAPRCGCSELSRQRLMPQHARLILMQAPASIRLIVLQPYTSVPDARGPRRPAYSSHCTRHQQQQSRTRSICTRKDIRIDSERTSQEQ